MDEVKWVVEEKTKGVSCCFPLLLSQGCVAPGPKSYPRGLWPTWAPRSQVRDGRRVVAKGVSERPT